MSTTRLQRSTLSSADAGSIVVTATGFSGLFGGTETTLQACLDVLDTVDATNIPVTTTGFAGELSAADDTVQKALSTLDDHTH